MKEGKPFILISSGGTGGHMSPASALAQDLATRGFHVELATDDRGLKFTGMFKNIPVHLIPSGTAGAGLKGKIKGGLNLLRGMKVAFALVRKLRPEVVIGFGGYPSVPAVLVAQLLGIPTIIHEQNAVLGLANKILAPRVRRLALSLAIIDNPYQAKSEITGNPIRPELSALHDVPYVPHTDVLRLLVMGGSLGATVFSEIVPEALLTLPPEDRKRLKIIQQARAADLDGVRAKYEAAGIDATLSTFFENVAEEIAKAHLIIGRSGASTVAEISAAGRPAIFVPYPHHKDQQQKRNAQGLADYGGAWLITEDHFTPKYLHDKLELLLKNQHILKDTADKARVYGKPDAAKRLGDLVESLVKKS
jgi:UDP-N-acetylglucosamine--N-acetylmuramyl-(pentapeptide) pyrophosphoryl-undecaprenol N-acetylglucosamine transferase